MAISTYSSLQTAVANWLNRSDLTSRIPEFISMAEAKLRRDPRARRLRVNSSFTVDAATKTLDTNWAGVESLAHDGATYYGELVKTSVGALSGFKKEYGDSGVPRAFAIVPGDNVYRFAPVPNATFTLVHSWWETIPRLGGAVLQNWLLSGYPDIYLHATLMQAEPYIKNDPRVALWETALERNLQELKRDQNRKAYSGDLSSPGSLIW